MLNGIHKNFFGDMASLCVLLSCRQMNFIKEIGIDVLGNMTMALFNEKPMDL